MTACTICEHPRRSQIEIALTYGMGPKAIARRYECSLDAIKRHARNHLTVQMRAAILAAQKPHSVDLEALERSEAEGILSQLVTQRARLAQHGEVALDVGDVRSAVAVERAITSNLELVAKLLGTLITRHEVRSTSFLISPDYIELRHCIISTLRAFPEASRAVADALAKLETASAETIMRERPRLPPVNVKAETVP